jgi:hypothetical protein
MSAQRAYEEIADFIASESPRKVVAFRPSEATRARVADLVQREKTGGLSPAETSELEHYLQLEHIMRLAKARAQNRLRRKAESAKAADASASRP